MVAQDFVSEEFGRWCVVAGRKAMQKWPLQRRFWNYGWLPLHLGRGVTVEERERFLDFLSAAWRIAPSVSDLLG
jgi:hypothetical protein